MKRNPSSESGIFNRHTLAFVLVAAGCILGLAGFASTGPSNINGPAISSGARIYVTTTVQKIGGLGTGGCSLQEAIYSAVLHDSLDGGAHGVALVGTDPDHFVTTECVMGTGNGDTIVLPRGAIFQVASSLESDAYNYMGPTATPMIYSTMTIEASGATLQWVGNGNSRLFAIGTATVKTPNGTASGTGAVTIRNVYVKGFHVKGGDGADGGGGGLGAGGAIYLQNGTVVVENSTFEGNHAEGGRGSTGGNGGGGGLSGNGGNGGLEAGGGGGGARGNGGNGGEPCDHDNCDHEGGGGGGGTVFSGGDGGNDSFGGQAGPGPGGYLCGGTGAGSEADGHQGSCLGGGGGGAGIDRFSFPVLYHDGGDGNYGGGGGGGVGHGGQGRFGGGGGAGLNDDGGSGGFGGGGAASVGGDPGRGGPFGGNGNNNAGGGGGALGGAIFNDGGKVTIHNCTFYNNIVTRGNGNDGSDNGADAGGAVFSFNGELRIVNSTVAGNQSTGSGGGIVFDNRNLCNSGACLGSTNSLVLDNTIVANNGANECMVIGPNDDLNIFTSAGAGNLIKSNGSGSFSPCPGVVATADPQLQSLQPASVNGGFTPTMAIPLYSSAIGAADPNTSFPYDQRYADRPQPDQSPRNGYDIGAYEVCRRFLGGRIQPAGCSTSIAPQPETTLTMQVSPNGVYGTTDPAPGTHTEFVNDVIPVTANASSGYHFVNWTGNVADRNSASTTVTMSQAQTVTANFTIDMPTPTPPPTPTPTPAPTSTPRATPTPTPCRSGCGPTPTPTATPTSTPVPSATPTPDPTPTPTPTPFSTPTPTPPRRGAG